MNEMESNNHGERITAVEAEVRALTANVVQLASLMREGHENTTREIKQLGMQIAGFGRANWPTYIAGMGLILTLGAAALGPVWMRQTASEEQIKSMGDLMHAHALLPVHPVAAEQLRVIEKRLNKLEDQ